MERVVGGCSLSVGLLAVVEKVVGGCSLSVGMLAVVEKVVGGWRCGWSKITIAKEKRLPQRSQPG